MEEIKNLINQELGVSDWNNIAQARVDAHTETKGDSDWLHNDPNREAKASPPNGKMVAPVFLLLSHSSQLADNMLPMLPLTHTI